MHQKELDKNKKGGASPQAVHWDGTLPNLDHLRLRVRHLIHDQPHLAVRLPHQNCCATVRQKSHSVRAGMGKLQIEQVLNFIISRSMTSVIFNINSFFFLCLSSW